MGAHTTVQPVVDRPDLEIDSLQPADGALDEGEGFVALTVAPSSSAAAGRLVRTT